MLPLSDDNSARRSLPGVTYILIAINIGFFLLELVAGDWFIIDWSFVPLRFLSNPPGDFFTLFTSLFLHGGWLHLLGNMLYLWIFGDNIEDRFGHFKFLVFYVICGLGATFAHMLFNMNSDVPTLGASGAIAGVLGAYIVLYPKARVSVLMGFFIIPLPALVVIGFWILLQFFSGVGSIFGITDEGGIAYMAHIGGFIIGLIVALFVRAGQRSRVTA